MNFHLPFIGASSLALHGGPFRRSAYEPAYNYFISLFNKFDSKPLKVSVTGPGISPHSLSFDAWVRRLKKKDFSEIKGFGFETHYFGNLRLGGTFKVQAYFNISDTTLLSFDNALQPFSKNHFLESYIAYMYQLNPFEYGYFYSRAFYKGAAFYAQGTLSDSISKNEEEQLIRWAHYLSGVSKGERSLLNSLRDVFIINILSTSHLELPVNGKSLKEWIISSNENGSLKANNENISIWRVPKKHIPRVRDELKRANLLVAYRDY